MILLQGSNLARQFGAETLFEDIQITVQDTSRIGLVGRNGTGKSTLLKILAGIESPDHGTVSQRKGTRIAYMDQHTAVNSERTVYEEMKSVFAESLALIDQANQAAMVLADQAVIQDPDRYEQALKTYDQLQEEINRRNAYSYDSEIRMVLHGFRFPEEMYDQPIAQMSGGQRTRLALAKVLLEKRDILILDEPTNHLDIDTLNWLEGYLPKYPGALLIVSHDRYFLDHVTNETYEMTHHGIEHYAGNYSFYLKEKAVRLETQMKAYEKQQKEIHKLEDYIARNLVRASTTKMAQSRRKQLERMDKLERPQQDERSARIQFSTEKSSGNVVLTVDDLAIGYEDCLSYPINIDLRKQKALAVVGPNGVGKSTLLKTITGQIPALEGDYKLGTNVSLGYYDQELGNLNSKKDVLHELWDDHPAMNEQDIRTILGSFLFSGSDVEKPVHGLSGGEKARLELAKLALDHDNFLVLDEPTNHLDIDSKEVLENALIDYDGTLLFVSHDRYFINRLATEVLEISEDGSKLYLGDYDYYLAKKAEEEARQAAQASTEDQEKVVEEKSSGKISYEANKQKQREQRRQQRLIDQCEEEISQVEEEIQSIENEMAKPEVYQDNAQILDLNAQLEPLKQHHQDLMDQWEKLLEEL